MKILCILLAIVIIPKAELRNPVIPLEVQPDHFTGNFFDPPKARWDSPSSICSNCYCEWNHYKYCFGGCAGSSKFWYGLTTDSNGYTNPHLDDLFMRVSNKNTDADDEVTDAECFSKGTNSPVLNENGLNLHVFVAREPVDCTCTQIGTSVLPLTTQDKAKIHQLIQNKFDSSNTASTTVISH